MPSRPQLRDLALQILEGGSLWQDKCVSLAAFADDAPGVAYAAPAVPGRAPSISLRRSGSMPAPPTPGRLGEAHVRGRLLHAMANHELQALELMALALLRFPHADTRFRRGLAHVMADEQRHLTLYVHRMEALGVHLDALPLSDFFWRALRAPPDPLTFIVQMGLVLEQANLDFAAHWSARMRAAGDTETAAILDQVYAEEIGHVRHGVRWATRWKDDQDTLWQTFLTHTAEPMTPARAVGPCFDETARRRAGLPPDFIDRLRTAGVSRGRPADVWWFHPAVEAAQAHARTSAARFQPRKTVARLAHDLAALPAVLATAGDIVLVPTPPRPDWLAHRYQAGLPMVQFVHDCGELVGRTLGGAQPWGWSPTAARRARDLLLPAPSRDPALGSKTWPLELTRALLTEAAEPWWSPVGVVPAACTSMPELLAAVRALRARDVADVVVKGAWSASGQQRWVLRCGAAPTPDEHARLEGLLRRHGEVTVGPWLDRAMDLSFHADVATDGSCRVRGVVRFATHPDGRFAGASLAAPHRHLDRRWTRWLLDDGRDPDRLHRTATAVFAVLGPALAAAGHHGPVGVDALVHHTPDGPRLWPLVEVNPRWTMGRVALALRSSVARPAWLRLVDRRTHPTVGAPAGHPLPVPPRDPRGRLCGGPVWLTDPREAQVAAVVELDGPDPTAEAQGPGAP